MKNSPRTATSVLTMRIVVRALGNTNMRLCACLALFGVASSLAAPTSLGLVDVAGNTNDRGSGARGRARTNRTVCCNSANCCLQKSQVFRCVWHVDCSCAESC